MRRETKEKIDGLDIAKIGSSVGCFIPGLNLIAAPIAVASVVASNKAKEELNTLRRNYDGCNNRKNRRDHILDSPVHIIADSCCHDQKCNSVTDLVSPVSDKGVTA